MRARERDTSRLHHLGTLAVRSAVRVSLCERDEHKSDSLVWGPGDSAPHDHAYNPMRPETPDKRPSESHTRASTAFSSRVPSLVPASRAQIVDDTYFLRARSAIRICAHGMLAHGRGARPHARATPTPPSPRRAPYGPITPDLAARLPTARVSHSGFHRYANARNQGEGSGARFARARARANLENFPSQIPPAAASPCISHVRVLVQLTIDEIPLGLVFRDGRARLYASRGS